MRWARSLRLLSLWRRLRRPSLRLRAESHQEVLKLGGFRVVGLFPRSSGLPCYRQLIEKSTEVDPRMLSGHSDYLTCFQFFSRDTNIFYKLDPSQEKGEVVGGGKVWILLIISIYKVIEQLLFCLFHWHFWHVRWL